MNDDILLRAAKRAQDRTDASEIHIYWVLEQIQIALAELREEERDATQEGMQ